jgi:hypothetical protein
MSQIEELLGMMYTWLGRRIQLLQKCTRFGFEYFGISDSSQFSAEHIKKGEALL